MASPPSWLKEGPKSASKEEGEAQSTGLLPAPLRATASQIWSLPYRWGQELASKRAVTQDPRSLRKQTEGLGMLPEPHLLVWETVFGNLVSCKASLDHPRTLQRKSMFSSQHSPPDEGSALPWGGLLPHHGSPGWQPEILPRGQGHLQVHQCFKTGSDFAFPPPNLTTSGDWGAGAATRF